MPASRSHAAWSPSAEDLFEQAPCGYLTTDPAGRIARANTTFLTWTGAARADVEGARVQDLLAVGSRIYWETHCAPLLRMQGTVSEIALDLVCADGRRLPVLMNAVLDTERGDRPAFVRMTVLDATDRRRYERELVRARDAERAAREKAETLQAQLLELSRDLERLAHVDVLTGTDNRRSLEQHLRRVVARAHRRASAFGVALIDVDRFKAINDEHGHDVGDAVLRVVAERARDCTRQEDVIGRWGGEEFLLLAPDTVGDGMTAVCERIRRRIGEEPIRHGEALVEVTVSIGWASWPDESADSLLRRADAALYVAKRAGRDRVVAAEASAQRQ